MNNLDFLRELVEEHEADAEHLDAHTKDSVINLYKNLLEITKALLEVTE